VGRSPLREAGQHRANIAAGVAILEVDPKTVDGSVQLNGALAQQR
jgi:hypothetical protein